MLDVDIVPRRSPETPILLATLDAILSAQLVVAWAGEGGEMPRLAWWRSDFTSEFGGMDLFRRLLPSTAVWATLQAAREAARRTDARLRAQDHDPDGLVSLFRLGYEIDERLDERLLDLKRSGRAPQTALPNLEGIELPWDPDRFLEWVRARTNTTTVPTPSGRRIEGDVPDDLVQRVHRLVAALAPLAPQYPLPHFRRSA